MSDTYDSDGLDMWPGGYIRIHDEVQTFPAIFRALCRRIAWSWRNRRLRYRAEIHKIVSVTSNSILMEADR